MRWNLLPLIVIVLFTTPFLSKAQEQSAYRQKVISIPKDSFLLDTAVLHAGSVQVQNQQTLYIEGTDFRINYFNGYLYNLRIPPNTLVQIKYEAAPIDLRKKFMLKNAAIIHPEFKDIKNPFTFEPTGPALDPLIGGEGLQVNGSIMRGLSVGNSQGTVINSNLNLQLAGRLNNEVDVLAAISDDNNPVQPEGNTQQLQDFDQVYVKFSKDKHELILGDFLMNKPANSYFLNYYKKSRGLHAGTTFSPIKNATMNVMADAALSRGRFVRNTIKGIEGNQGPYRLTGANGELFIILVSGTEAVYLDGERLRRGEQNDYTIDYNTGEITFMPKRLITQYSRIIVEFQYSDRNYARTLFNLHSDFQKGRTNIYLNYFTEQDNKNQPFQQSLSDSNKALLASVGNNLDQAVLSSASVLRVFDPTKILYRKTDSLGIKGVYVYAADPAADSVFYELRFTYLGSGKGNYVQSSSAANGRVFKWVQPVNGLPQGDFEPIIKLIAPNKRQMLSIGTIVTLNKDNEINIELVRSSYDRNTFSSIGKDQDAGYGAHLKIKNRNRLNANLDWNNEVEYEFVDKQLRYVERYRNVEFDRTWQRQLTNSQNTDTGYQEHIVAWRTGLKQSAWGGLQYQLGFYDRASGLFNGFQHLFNLNLQRSLYTFTGLFERMDTKQQAFNYVAGFKNQVQRLNLNLTRKVSHVLIGAKVNAESSKYFNNGDSLVGGSFNYRAFGAFIKNADSTRIKYTLSWDQRLDLAPVSKDFKSNTLSNEVKSQVVYLQKNSNRLSVDAAFRNFEVKDTAFSKLKPEQTMLCRLEYDYSFLKRWLTANSYIQLGSGNELRRDFQFVEVPKGQGIYVWKDFNNDGLQQLNEFQQASFADRNQANYIKVFLPTTSMIRTHSSVWSQTFNINPYTAWSVRSGIRKLLSKFSNQSAWRLERKLAATDDNMLANPFLLQVSDSSLINVTSQFRNTFFFQRADPKFGMEWTVQQTQSKVLQTNGFEGRNRLEQSTNLRYGLNRSFTLQSAVNFGTRISTSAFFSDNNYNYTYHEWRPKLQYQYLQKVRVGLNAGWFQGSNSIEQNNEKGEVREIGLEFRYSLPKMGVLTMKYSLYQVNYDGNTATPLAYDMLQGLSQGSNQLWNLNLQQRLGQNLQLNFNYDGRKSGSNNIIHTGKMEARYLF